MAAKKKTSKKEGPKILKTRSIEFRKVYATNVMIKENDIDIRLYWFNEVVDTPDGRFAVSDGVTIIAPEAAIILHEQLDAILKQWIKKGKRVVVAKERRNVLKALKEGP